MYMLQLLTKIKSCSRQTRTEIPRLKICFKNINYISVRRRNIRKR